MTSAVTQGSPGNCSDIVGGGCEGVLIRGVCHPGTGECGCRGKHPVRIADSCVNASKLDGECIYTEQCQHHDQNAVCSETDTGSICVCSEGYSKGLVHGPGVRSATGHVRPVCDLARTESHVEDVATLTGLGVGLSLLAVFIWFTLRLFSKARHVESRGFGDASLPPTIMVEGKDVSGQEVADTVSRTSSKSRIYTPGPPLTPSQVRRMSELSSLSVTVQERDFKMRPVSPNPQSVGGSLDMLFEEGKDESVEQQLTIIPKLGSFQRRKSLVNHAFPELHRKSSTPSNSLVILTRTKTDSQGRRHSVAVPLLAAPPSAVSRQGLAPDTCGYVIERKPREGSRDGSRDRAHSLAHRRHSLQVGAGLHRGPGSGSRSPRRSSTRRHSRRPSKQGFYQFLEQAVAF